MSVSAAWATCTAGNCTGVRLPGRYLCLAHADDRARTAALARMRADAPVDLRGMTLDDRLLNLVQRALPTDDRRRPVWTGARWDGAIIEAGPALDLAGHEFAEGTSWRGIVVRRPVILRGARLTLTDLREAVFEEHIDAEGAEFAGPLRCDDAIFRNGITLDGARFDGGFDLRRVAASQVLLAAASVHGPADASLSRIGTLDLSGSLLTADLVLDDARLERVVLTGTTVEGAIRTSGASVGQWEPRFADLLPDGPDAPGAAHAVRAAEAWRPDLLGEADPAGCRWVVVEEWVGHGEVTDGPDGPGYQGGVIGLQLSPWPGMDAAGHPDFDEAAVRMVAVEADAFAEMLRVLLDEAFTPLRVGDVYAMRFEHEPPEDPPRPLTAAGLHELGEVYAIDVTRAARDAAKAAFWSVLVPALDAEADAALIAAMTATDRDAR